MIKIKHLFILLCYLSFWLNPFHTFIVYYNLNSTCLIDGIVTSVFNYANLASRILYCLHVIEDLKPKNKKFKIEKGDQGGLFYALHIVCDDLWTEYKHNMK